MWLISTSTCLSGSTSIIVCLVFSPLPCLYTTCPTSHICQIKPMLHNFKSSHSWLYPWHYRQFLFATSFIFALISLMPGLLQDHAWPQFSCINWVDTLITLGSYVNGPMKCDSEFIVFAIYVNHHCTYSYNIWNLSCPTGCRLSVQHHLTVLYTSILWYLALHIWRSEKPTSKLTNKLITPNQSRCPGSYLVVGRVP